MKNKLIYLDNSATSFPKPKEVYDFMDSFYRSKGIVPGRTGNDVAMEVGEMVDHTRQLLTRLFNGGEDYNRLVFSHNATDSLNMVIQGLAAPDTHVITTMLEHNSVLRPLYHLQKQGIIDVDYLPFDGQGYVNPDDFQKALRPQTRFVVCTHASNVLGTVQPLAEIGAICRERGIIFVVDGAQGAGISPVDMQAQNIDVYVFTGHKSLMGATGTGGAYIREGVVIALTRYGGTGVRSAQAEHLEEYPYRLETGTPNILGIAGLKVGVEWVMKNGVESLHAREIALWDRLRQGLQSIDGVVLYCADASNLDSQNPVLSFTVNGFAPSDVATWLDVNCNIVCRTGLQCAPKVHEQIGTIRTQGTIRFSIGAFNTVEDIDRAVAAVEEITAIRN